MQAYPLVRPALARKSLVSQALFKFSTKEFSSRTVGVP